jgi:hypothetical protein
VHGAGGEAGSVRTIRGTCQRVAGGGAVARVEVGDEALELCEPLLAGGAGPPGVDPDELGLDRGAEAQVEWGCDAPEQGQEPAPGLDVATGERLRATDVERGEPTQARAAAAWTRRQWRSAPSSSPDWRATSARPVSAWILHSGSVSQGSSSARASANRARRRSTLASPSWAGIESAAIARR